MSDRRSRRGALVLALSGSLLTPLMGSAINVALPSIGREFHMDAVMVSWVSTWLHLGCCGLFGPGREVGRYSRAETGVRIGALRVHCFVLPVHDKRVASHAYRFSCIAGPRRGYDLFHGHGYPDLGFPLGRARQSNGPQRGSCLSGLSVGPFVGGLITEHFSWRGVFLLIIPIGVLAWALSEYMLQREWADAKGEPFDLLGATLYCLTLLLVSYGLSVVPEQAGVSC